jgi:MFS family permease
MYQGFEEEEVELNTQLTRYAGWIAYANGICATASFVTLMLFFTLDAEQASANPSQVSFSWGTLNDIIGVIAMLPMLLLALVLYQMERARAAWFSLLGLLIGVAGMLCAALLQLLLVLKVIPFEQEVGPLVVANAVIGLWLMLANHAGRIQNVLSARLAWLGIVVGVSFVCSPFVFSALGGALGWRALMSNNLLLTVTAFVFLLMYVGFPVWAVGLGRTLSATQREPNSPFPRQVSTSV